MSWTSPQCHGKVLSSRCGLEEGHPGEHEPWKRHVHQWVREPHEIDDVEDYTCLCGATKSVYQHTDSEGTNLTIRTWCPHREENIEN